MLSRIKLCRGGAHFVCFALIKLLQRYCSKMYYNIIIDIKNFYDQPIYSDTKRKLATGQRGDYTAVWLLDYKYIKNYYKLIAVDLPGHKN